MLANDVVGLNVYSYILAYNIYA
ncbi:hypothetical protein F383_37877 [Gossypium arboreum]|uniref:Uncharacterized protein n=1 Tax=Gossypium arboreum TaxID=29729 RepID=A0A0B0M918_GOSAR|nr:hypothetical protein F383_37877 [Gossypium arboreum]